MARFLLDENLPPHLATALNAAGHDAITSGEAALLTKSDREVFDRAQDLGRIVVTQDVQFMNFPLSSHSGIVVIRLSRLAPSAWLDRVVAALTHEIVDMRDCRAIVNERRTRIRRL